jgi:hypothetical protein
MVWRWLRPRQSESGAAHGPRGAMALALAGAVVVAAFQLG